MQDVQQPLEAALMEMRLEAALTQAEVMVTLQEHALIHLELQHQVLEQILVLGRLPEQRRLK